MARANTFQEMAAEAVERIEDARAMGQQLTFLPDEPQPGDGAVAKRGKGKAQSELRNWLAARGMRLPEDVLVEMAGMASTEDVFTTAMARTEQLLAWAEAGDKGGRSASMAMRLDAFRFVYTAALRAAEALLPYGLAKVTPDQGNTVVNQIIMPGAQAPVAGADRAAAARDITPQARRMAPPPMPHEIQQNQGLDDVASGHSDADIRT
jgi:hypothetical protein